MKKILIATLSATFVAVPAFAAGNSGNIGFDFSVKSAFGVHGELDISSLTNKAPVSAQVFLKNYSQNTTPGMPWDTTGIGAAGIYDLTAIAKLDKKIHPYIGVGLVYINHKWIGYSAPAPYTGIDSGLYVTGGVRYALTPHVVADFNYNNFGSFTAGINFGF